MYFGSFFDNTKEKEAYDLLRKRTSLVLESIINDINNAPSIDIVDGYLLSMSKPKSYSGATNVEIQYNKQFESMCMLITQTVGMNAKTMTVFEFYTAIDQIKKQTPKRK